MRVWLLMVLAGLLGVFLFACGPNSAPANAVPTPTPPSLQPPAASYPSCISADDTSQHVGETVCVQFRVVRTYNSGKAVFLDLHDPYQGYFQVTIFPEKWNCWSQSPEQYFKGRLIQVQGQLRLYQGAPEIIVRDCSQIEMVQ